jgi:hypothetical protein
LPPPEDDEAALEQAAVTPTSMSDAASAAILFDLIAVHPSRARQMNPVAIATVEQASTDH